MKNKTSTAILALFLGGLGIHRFYLGQTGLGILCLFFFWTFIPAIVGFADFILFLTMTDENFNIKYNKGMPQPIPTNLNTVNELEKLHSVMKKGIISDAEFQNKKVKILY